MVNIQSKEVLARLLATENLTVVHQNVQTASFNVKDRVLTLPMWDEMENYTYDHLVGHEVAHALFTPGDEWISAAENGGDGFQSFLNVVEDARIEKLIQRRYPGLRKPFIQSYKKLLSEGFFGKSADEINSFKLIDRLNVLFKCGQTVGVQFNEEEKSWIKEIENAETFDQVIDIATRLYGKAKEEHEEEQQAMSKAMALMQEENGDEENTSDAGEYGLDYESGSEVDSKAENGFEEESDEEQGEKTNNDKSSVKNQKDAPAEANEEPDQSQSKKSGHDGSVGGPESITDKSLSENISKEFGGDPNITFLNLNLNLTPKITNDRVIDYKTIIKVFGETPDAIEAGGILLKKFMTNNKKTINYLVKEFEMKKKAAEYKRATVSKTGVLDTLKMNNYMFSDDVFKKMTILPEGKNHGLLMFIDWSGSMSDQLHHTVDQLLNLVMFCKQVNIPFQVYAFSDRWDRGQKFYPYDIFSENDLVYQEDFRLLELFSSKMNRSAFQTMAKAVIATANYWENRSNVYRGTSDVGSYSIPYSMWLGGTPLDDAIVSSIVLHDQFKKSNRLDIVNMIFLTDGASSAMEYIHNAEYLGRAGVVKERLSFGYYKSKDKVCYINNPVTKSRFRIDTNRDVTAQLIEIVRKHTNANIIGFHILPGRKPQAMREIPSKNIDWFDRENLWDNMRKDKFCLIPDCGYDAYFGVLGGKHLATSNGAIEVEDDASKAKIRTAFKKANSGRKTSRIMLSKFIDLVA